MTSTTTDTITRTALTRLRDRAVTDRAELDRLLDDTFLAHVGLADGEGGVVVMPTAVVRDGNSVLVHGSTGSGWMRRAAAGHPACLTVTDLSGIIFDARRLGDPLPAPDLRAGIPVPASVRALTART